jgi:hypothetical protein
MTAAQDAMQGDGTPVDAGTMPTVFEARSEFEAQCVRGVLEDAGIRSVTVPTGQGIFGFPLRAGARTVPVRVLPDDLSRARQALSEARWTGKSVDWDEVDVGEMPPEVARVLAGARRDRWVRRAFLAVAWVALAFVALAAVSSLAGCSYRLEGKVVDGFSGARIARAGDPEDRKGGIPGATIELVRDANTMNRSVAARATSGPDGRFELEVEGFGAGWMEEEWHVRVRRSGYENVEAAIGLPGSTKDRLLLVNMARGRSRRFSDPENAGSIIDQAREFEPGIGGSRP